jgi:hypothetical protein
MPEDQSYFDMECSHCGANPDRLRAAIRKALAEARLVIERVEDELDAERNGQSKCDNDGHPPYIRFDVGRGCPWCEIEIMQVGMGGGPCSDSGLPKRDPAQDGRLE